MSASQQGCRLVFCILFPGFRLLPEADDQAGLSGCQQVCSDAEPREDFWGFVAATIEGAHRRISQRMRLGHSFQLADQYYQETAHWSANDRILTAALTGVSDQALL